MIQLYKNKIFPFLMNKSLKKDSLKAYRINILNEAYGRILEIGYGTGLNADCYPTKVEEINAIDSIIMHSATAGLKVKLHKMSVTNMDFKDNSFDTVVSTFTLCTVADIKKAIDEIKRVLKPGGQLLFLEHGKGNHKLIVFLQQVLNPLYNILACGCNVNRDFKKIITVNGFILEKCNKIKIKGKPITGYTYVGIAKKQR